MIHRNRCKINIFFAGIIVSVHIPRSFLQQIIDHIVVNDGRVISITFKNGSTHTFTYKT